MESDEETAGLEFLAGAAQFHRKRRVYSKFNNKPGYAGLRTLIRYTQLDDGLRQGLPLAELAKSTGRSESLLAKVSQWWNEEFGGKSPAN
jgi:hypothetical protein